MGWVGLLDDIVESRIHQSKRARQSRVESGTAEGAASPPLDNTFQNAIPRLLGIFSGERYVFSIRLSLPDIF